MDVFVDKYRLSQSQYIRGTWELLKLEWFYVFQQLTQQDSLEAFLSSFQTGVILNPDVDAE